MAEILNQNTEIETPLDNVTEKRKTKQSTPETTVDYLGNVNPSIGGYVGNLYDQTADPSMGNLSRQDIYPTLPEPTIRQGIQGQFVKMPTVVTPAGLIPYELIYEQERQREQQEQQKLLKREQDNFYNLSIPEINQAEANVGFAKAKVNWYQNITAAAKEKYGDNYIKFLKEDKNFQLTNKLFDDNAKYFNNTYALAKGFVDQAAKDSPYTSPEAIKAAREFISYTDKYMSGKTADELELAAKKMAETTNKLQRYANVQNIVESHAKVLRENTDKFATQLDTISKASTYDEKVMALNKLEGNFLQKKVDDKGNETYEFNEDWAKDDWAKTFESSYGKLMKKDDGTYELADENMARFAPDPNSFIQQGLNVTRNLIEPEIKSFSTGNYSRENLSFQKNQAFKVPRVLKNGSETNPVYITDSDGTTRQAVEHWNFADSPIEYTGSLTKLGADGKSVPISGIKKGRITSFNKLVVNGELKYVAYVEYLEPNRNPQTGDYLLDENKNIIYDPVVVPVDAPQVIEAVNNRNLAGYNDELYDNINTMFSTPKAVGIKKFTTESTAKGNKSSGTTKKSTVSGGNVR